MTRSRFFASSDAKRQQQQTNEFACEPCSAAAATNSSKSSVTTNTTTTSSGSSSSSRWRRPRLRRSHAHEFNEELLPEKVNLAVTPALSQSSLGSGHTEAPSSRGTSASTLSTCSPALTAVEDGILEVDDFELDEGGNDVDDSSWLDADLPSVGVLPSPAAADDDYDDDAGGEDSDFDEEVQQRQQQQKQRFSGPLVLRVQDFECGECIGKGSYSRVYLGSHPLTGTEWALKVVSKRKTFETRENLAHLREEKYVSTKLEGSDFLVRTAGTFQNTRSVVFAMEYLPGGDLYQRLSDKGTLSLGEAVAWTAQAVLAVEDLHAKNIVHRDVKPENFLMGKSGTLKLTDFGFARELQPDERLYSQFGTPEYVAPEVLSGCGHGMAVDLWALGVLIYELLVGQTPFKSASVDEMYERIAAGDYAFPAAPALAASEERSRRSTTRSAKGAAKSTSLAGARKVGGGSSPQTPESTLKGVAKGKNYQHNFTGGTENGRSKDDAEHAPRAREEQQPAQLEKLGQRYRHHSSHKSNSTKRTSTTPSNATTTRNSSNSSASNTSSSTPSRNKRGGRDNTKAKGKRAASQDPAAQALVKALLSLSPGHRPSIPEIKRHPFFTGVDFAGLRAAVRAQTEDEEEEAVVSAAIDGGEVWVRGQPVVCCSEEADDNYGGVFAGF